MTFNMEEAKNSIRKIAPYEFELCFQATARPFLRVPRSKYTKPIEKIPGVEQTRQENGKLFTTASSAESTTTIPQVFNVSSELAIKIDGISAKEPSLDDVFLTYTGRTLRDEEGSAWTARQTLVRLRRARA